MEKWFIYSKKADFAAIAEKFHISPMFARILRNRDLCTDEEINYYLHADASDMYDPFLLKGMFEGIELVIRAAKAGGKIRIIGDYDVDGVCASFILQEALIHYGADADVRLPDRIIEGYGMNTVMAYQAAEDNISLIITCDNGISSVDAIAKAKELGINVLVTDHHAVSAQLPAADVIIDPKQADCTYPYKEICGAGVAYKFVQALLMSTKENKRADNISDEALLDSLLQFAGMATITDIVPLKDENRIFAREGIKRLQNTDNIGLKALMSLKNIEPAALSAHHIGFILGPCINSAGRLENAIIAYNLLKASTYNEALQIAQKLIELNDERKSLTHKPADALIEEIDSNIEAGEAPDKIMVFYLPDAHESVAGIIAGRLKEKYNRPAIVLTDSSEGPKGSGRSVDCYNMIEALSAFPELFVKFGGHSKAAGFTLKCRPKELAKALNSSCNITDEDLQKKIWVDMQLPFRYVTESFVREIESMEPFGVDNQAPLFAERDIRILEMKIIGRNENVLKMKLQNADGDVIEGIMFSSHEIIETRYNELMNAKEQYGDEMRIRILYNASLNEWGNIIQPQAVISSLQIQ